MSFTVNPYDTNGHTPEGYWVQNPDEPDEWYQVAPLHNDIHQKLLEKHTRPGRNGQLRLNREAFYKALYDKILLDWSGIFSDSEKTIELPCTTDAKYALYCASSQRADFIWEKAQELANNDAARHEAERKNFRPVHQAPDGATESRLSRVSSEL